MSVRAVLRMGNPVLLERSEEIHDFNTRELNELIQDMKDTMTHFNGAGLAAPQIGELKRIVIFGFDSNERYPEASAVPFTVLINPTIHSLDETMEEGIEGCLSVPGLRALCRGITI